MVRIKYIKIFIISFLCLNLITFKYVYAKNINNLNSFLKELKQKQECIKTLVCDIKQIKKSKLFTHPIIFVGKLYYQKPNNIRYEFNIPIFSAIIINNRFILKCTEGMQPIKLKRNTIDSMLKNYNLNLLFNIKNLSNLINNFNVTFSQNRRNFILLLISKQNRQIKYIKLIFSKVDLAPHKLIFIDKEGNSTVIILNHIKINKKLSPEIFSKCY